jgi:hypothetical protein
LVKLGDIIRRWIIKEFARQRSKIKKELVTVRSRIYVSFDLWISPNLKGLIRVVFYYLSKDLKVYSILVGMRRLKGAYTDENIAEVVIPIIKAIGVIGQLRFFIGDNAGPNDIVIRAILSQLRPDIKDSDSRRVRCLGHIINLAVKVFLFGKDADAFEEEFYIKKELSKLEAVRELWRKKGPLGKFYNTVSFIRKMPQRREAFLIICGIGIEKDIEGEVFGNRLW